MVRLHLSPDVTTQSRGGPLSWIIYESTLMDNLLSQRNSYTSLPVCMDSTILPDEEIWDVIDRIKAGENTISKNIEEGGFLWFTSQQKYKFVFRQYSDENYEVQITEDRYS